MVEFTDEQNQAMDLVDRFFRNPNPHRPYFDLKGLAGTGKTTVLAEMAHRYKGAVLCAPTGKAASVLSRKTGLQTSTCHSAIYNFRGQYVADDGEKYLSFSQKIDDNAWQKKFALLDECFVAGTLVDTPYGPKPIENIKPGDKILNAIGVDTVTRISNRVVTSGTVIKAGRNTFTCSQNHTFFTERGTVCAEDLRPGDSLVRLSASMRLLRSAFHSSQRFEQTGSILQRHLLREMGVILEHGGYRIQKLPLFGSNGAENKHQTKSPFSIRNSGRAETNRQNTKVKSDTESRNRKENISNVTRYGAQTTYSRWQRKRFNKAANIFARCSRFELGFRVCCQHRKKNSKLSNLLQNRHSEYRNKNSHRDRWVFPSVSCKASTRRKKRCVSDFVRVDSVAIYESTDKRLGCKRDSSGGVRLYDLTCEQHPSFSVHGVLVHNCSMVETRLAEDLLATGARVVASGDPGQLPPVRGVAFFNTADFTLQTIHRQALESPIIRQAHSVRSYGQYKADGDDFRVTNFITADDILQADVILCWKNATRMALNKLVRAHKGISGLPRRGEPIMCLRNDRRMGVLNGATYELLNDYSSNDAEVRLVNERGDVVTVENSWFEVFDAPPDEEDEQESHPFTLAYAATIHKAQGSSYKSLILVDEYNRSDHRREWLYTGITRAEKSVIIHRE